MRSSSRTTRATCLAAAMIFVAGCAGGERKSRTLLQNKGSDTIVNVAQAWAANYRSVNPSVAVAVSGGGSGTGIAALINGTVDIANASRDIKPEEQDAIVKANGKQAVAHVVAYDDVVFYVHRDNPIEGVSVEQLACVYGEGGNCDSWGMLGVAVPSCADQSIIRVSRQSNSGTYEFVRDHVLGSKRDFKLGSRDMQGSKDVVDLVGNTPCAIGYSGLGYATDKVKALCVRADADSACVTPTVEAAKDGSYALARPLYMYTLGEPDGRVREYLDWIRSADGQRIVEENGFVPIR